MYYLFELVFVFGFGLVSGGGPIDAWRKCVEFYLDHVGVTDRTLIGNEYITGGGQGSIYRCYTNESNIFPHETGMSLYHDS